MNTTADDATTAKRQPNRLLRRSDLTAMLDAEAPCVSIYLPMVQAGPETEQNSIRFKNALREAENALAERGLEADDVARLLQPASGLVEDYDFWQNQSAGLAVLLAAGMEKILRLPMDFREDVSVGERFHLEPLLPLLSTGERFYVLALSQNEVRLFMATRHRIAEMDLPDAVPDSLADALGYDWEEKSLQFHGQRRAGRGREAIYHGQGSGHDDEEMELRRFLEILDKGLRESLTDAGIPLVLAGVEENVAVFRKVSKYPHIAEPWVAGNVDHLSPDELHQRLVEAIGELFGESVREAKRVFDELGGTDRTTVDLETIVVAAHDQRIDTLFVPRHRQVMGQFDPAARTIERVATDEAGNDAVDLLDLVVSRALSSDAKVFALEGDQIPAPNGSSHGQTPVAALLRY